MAYPFRYLFISSLLILSLFFTSQPVHALELFGIDSTDETSNIYAGSVENLKNWPPEVISAIESMQAKLLNEAEGKRNWMMDREIHGDIEIIKETKPKKSGGVFSRFGDTLVRIGTAIADVGKWFGRHIGLKPKEVLFTADAWVYGPQDCDYPLGKGSVRIIGDRFDIEGILTDPHNQSRKLEYEFIARMSLSFWDCPQGTALTNPLPQTTIDWALLGSTDPVALSRLFDGAFRNNLAFDYQFTNSAQEEQTRNQLDRNEHTLQKRHEAATKPMQTITPRVKPDCTLSDPTGDSIDELIGSPGSEPGVDITQTTITNQNNILSVTIETAGAIPPLPPDSSIAYEIGFDTGTGSKNPIFYRPGVDVVFVVDVANTAINSFKETPGGVQSAWTPLSAEKRVNGVTFTMPLSDVGQNTIPPLKIFTSYASGDIIEFDVMPNSGFATCQ